MTRTAKITPAYAGKTSSPKYNSFNMLARYIIQLLQSIVVVFQATF